MFLYYHKQTICAAFIHKCSNSNNNVYHRPIKQTFNEINTTICLFLTFLITWGKPHSASRLSPESLITWVKAFCFFLIMPNLRSVGTVHRAVSSFHKKKQLVKKEIGEEPMWLKNSNYVKSSATFRPQQKLQWSSAGADSIISNLVVILHTLFMVH